MKNKFLIGIGLILIGLSLISLCYQILIFEPESKFKEFKERFYISENELKTHVQLSKDAYLLRIRHKAKKELNASVLFNGEKFAANTFPYKQRHKDLKNIYIHIPRRVVLEGENALDITFFEIPPSEIRILLRNYRQNLGKDFYILFSDSANLSTGAFLGKNTPYISVLILLAGITAYLLGMNVSVNKQKVFLYRQKYLAIPFFFIFLMVICFAPILGYRALMTPYFLFIFAFFVSIIFLTSDIFAVSNPFYAFFSKKAESLLKQTKFDIKKGIIFCLLIATVNIFVYWPSFFHIFRHDEWFLFFSSRQEPRNLWFIIKHIDWQLSLPYDRLMFRPIHHGMLALNRVIFDANYIGPHIITFIKHILACLCMWWLMWEFKPRWISSIFVLLFSVLITNVDTVIWPHIDAYITTTIFTILAIIAFRKTIHDKISPCKGFTLTIFLLFVNLITTEIAFLMPSVFFVLYWTSFRNRSETGFKRKDQASFFILLTPMILWAIVFSIHVYFAYPNLLMTKQSEAAVIFMSFLNIIRMALILMSGIIAPLFSEMLYGDKIYFNITAVGFVLLAIVIFCCVRYRKNLFISVTEDLVFLIGLILSILIIVCFGRAFYVNKMLSGGRLSCHYVYCISSLIIIAIYQFFNFDKITANKKCLLALFLVLIFLITNHALKTYRIAAETTRRTTYLKNYFDSVRKFVAAHEKEPGFSFKIIDRPPKIEPFSWYSTTCIEGFFNRFINNQNPKYLFEYDYASEKLDFSYYSKISEPIQTQKEYDTSTAKADYVNSIGMKFKKISIKDREFLIGMFEVSQKEWKNVMVSNPSRFVNDNHPVENVSLNMVRNFIKRLNEIESGDLYRLPTEKEYRYLVNFYCSVSNKNIEKYALLRDNANQTTAPVGSLKCTPDGIYDLVGNVWEWTDTPIHSGSPASEFEGNPRICFGGSWRDSITDIGDFVTNYQQNFHHEHLGFRLIREIKKTDGKEH